MIGELYHGLEPLQLANTLIQGYTRQNVFARQRNGIKLAMKGCLLFHLIFLEHIFVVACISRTLYPHSSILSLSLSSKAK
jgi:hypothetical protein